MSVMDQANIQLENITNETDELDDLANNDFYCAKCYDMLNYFLYQCETLSPIAKKFEKCYFKCKKDNEKVKNKYETLEFNYEEIKAQKEDLEERYNLLFKMLAKSNINQENNNNEEPFSAHELSELLKKKLGDQIVKENTIINHTEEKYENNQLVEYSSESTTIKLDLNFLTQQIIGKSSINYELILKYFGKTINKVVKNSKRREITYNQSNQNQEMENIKKTNEKNEVALRNEIETLKRSLENSNAQLKETNEKLVIQEESFNEKTAKADELIKSLEMNLIERSKQLEMAIQNSNIEIQAEKDNAKLISNDYENKLNELNAFIASTDIMIENLMKEKMVFEQKTFVNATEINELKESNLKYQEEIEKLRHESNGYTSEIDRLKLEIQEALNNLSRVEIQYQTASENLNKANELNTNGTLMSNNLISDYENKLKEIAELEAITEKLNNETELLKKAQYEVEEKYQTELKRIESEHFKMSDEKLEEIKTLKTAESKYQQEIEMLREQSEQSASEILSLKNLNQEVINRLRLTESELNESTEKMIKTADDSKVDNSNLQTEIKNLVTENENLKAEIQQLNGNLERVKESHIEIETKYMKELEKSQNLEQDFKSTYEEINTLQDYSKDLQSQLTEKEKEKDDLSFQMKNYKDQVKELEDNIFRLDQQVKELTQNLIRFQLDNDYLNKALEDKTNEMQLFNNSNDIEKLNVNRKNKQRFSEPVYLDQIKRDELIEANNSSWSYSNVSNIFLETTDITINKIDQATSVENIADDTEGIEQLQHKLTDLMQKCVNLEGEKTISDEEITQLRAEVTKLKELIDDAKNETEKIINEYESKLTHKEICLNQIKEFIANDFNFLKSSNEDLKQNLALGYQEMENLKAESSSCLQQINDRYFELEFKYQEECKRTDYLNNLIETDKLSENENRIKTEHLMNEYEAKLSHLLKENEQISKEILELQNKLSMAISEKDNLLNEFENYKTEIQAEIQGLREELVRREDENKKLNLEYEQKVNDDLVELRQKYDEKTTQYAQLIETHDNEMKSLSEGHQVILNNVTNDYEVRLDVLVKEKEQICTEILDLQSKLETALTEKQNLQNEIDNYKHEFDELNIQIATEKENFANLEKYSRSFIEENTLKFENKNQILTQTKTELEDLKLVNYELNKSMEIAKVEHKNLTEKLNEIDELHRLEMENLRMNYGCSESELMNRLEESNAKLLSTESKVKSLQGDVLETQTEISSLRKELAQAEEDNLKLKEEYDENLQNALIEMREKATSFELKYNDEVTQNSEICKTYETQIINQQIRLNNLVGEYETRFNVLIEEKEQMSNEISNLESKLDTINAEKENLLNMVDNYKNEIIKIEAQFSSEKENLVKELEKMNKEQKTKNEFYVENKKKLESEINDLKTKCLNFENEISVRSDEIIQLNQEVNNFKQNIDNLREESKKTLEDWTKKYTEIENKYIYECKQTTDLNNLLQGNQREINDLIQNFKMKNESDLNILETENRSLKEKIINLENQAQSLIQEKNKTINHQSENLAQITLELDHLKQAYNELDCNLAKTVTQNTNLTKKLTECEELNQIKTENLKKSFDLVEKDLLNKLENSIEKVVTAELNLKSIQENVIEMKNEISKLQEDLVQKEDEKKRACNEYENRFNQELKDLRDKALSFELKYNDEVTQNCQTIEKHEAKLKTILENQQTNVLNLKNDYESRLNTLQNEKEQNSREILEIQRKLCAILTEKDNILNESILKKNQHDSNLAQQKELQSKLESEISELKLQLAILKTKPSNSMNDSLLSKINHQVEMNLQNKFDALTEEKAKHIVEIDKYKSDIVKLTTQFNADKEKLIKDHEKLSKEQQQQYHHKLKKQATEIKQLNEKVKDQQQTNDFLANQINRLNEHIYDIENQCENKENDKKENENKPHFVNKPVLEVSLIEDGISPDEMSNSKHLQPVNQNLRKVLDMSTNQTPTKAGGGLATPSSTTSSNFLATPSTERKKQVQCAQQ